MRNALIVVAAAVTLASQVSGQEQNPVPAPAAPKIEMAFEGNGVMSLKTTNASLRDILNEWTRKGGTPFPGAERLTGGSLTLEFPHKAETEVIASLLRSASGYVVATRQPGGPQGASNLEVVYVLAVSNATSSGYSPAPAYVPPPQPTTTGSVDREVPAAATQGGQTATTGAPPQEAQPPAYPRPAGVSGVAVPVITVPVSSSTPPTTGAGTTTTGTGSGRGGGAGR